MRSRGRVQGSVASPSCYRRDLTICTFVQTMKPMEIEFDPEKAAANPLRHDGVTFVEAQSVLLDPHALTRKDTDAQVNRGS